MKTITPRQLRAARALLGISAQELADLTQLGVATIRRAEVGTEVSLTAVNAQRLVATLKDAGVELVTTEDGGEGALYRSPDK